MLKSNALAIVLVMTLWGIVAPSTVAQDEDVAYTLTSVGSDRDNPKDIDVQFGDARPEDADLLNKEKWLVRAIEFANVNNQPNLPIDSIEFGALKLVTLHMREPIDPSRFKYVIIFRQANFPLGTLDRPPKTGASKRFTAANGKSDADIYVSGTATTAHDSGPLYSIEAKVGYLHDLGDAGEIGGRFEFVSDEGSDVDPDSILATAAYKKVFPMGRGAGIILKSDFLGFELDKENETRNLTTEITTIFVPRSKLIGETNFAAIRFLTGLEVGHNFRNSLNPRGFGNFWRPKIGMNGYFVALNPPIFNRIVLSGEYILRLPQSAEPFTEKINGTKQTFLTRRPRHYVGVDLDLLFAPTYGLTIKYRYGSLPPVFNLIDNKASIGLTFMLKQVK